MRAKSLELGLLIQPLPQRWEEYVALAASTALDFLPGGKALKLFKGASAKLGLAKLKKLLTKQAKKKAGKLARGVKSAMINSKVFPGLRKVKGKTSVKGSSKLRERWVDKKGNIYEWDYRHNTLEKYNKRGRHLGEFDPQTGKQLRSANPNYKIDP